MDTTSLLKFKSINPVSLETNDGFLFTPFDSSLETFEPNLMCSFYLKKSQDGTSFNSICDDNLICKRSCSQSVKFGGLEPMTDYDIKVVVNKYFGDVFFDNLKTGNFILDLFL